MKIVEHTPSRLTMEARPWIQSFLHLGFALFFTWFALEELRLSAGGWGFWAMLPFVVFLWAVFFVKAQYTRITFDRDEGLMRIVRQRVFGHSGAIVPLAAIHEIRTEDTDDFHTLPWRYRLLLDHEERTQISPCPMVHVKLTGDEAHEAMHAMSRWLDSGRLAA